MRARPKIEVCPRCQREKQARVDSQARLARLRSTTLYGRKRARELAKAMEAVATMFEREIEASAPHLNPFP